MIILIQGFIILATAVTLLLVYGICMLRNAKATIYSSHEHMPVYVDKIGVIIGKIHFLVLAVPIIMFGAFAVGNVKGQYPRETILWYSKVVLTITIVAGFIGALVQTICITKDDNNKRLRP